MDCNKVIGQRIGMIRTIRGETQQQLADALHVKREMVAYWENSTRQIKPETILEIALHYGISVDYLFGQSEVYDHNDDAQATFRYTGLTPKALDNIRTIKAERLDDGLNFLIEAYSFMEIVERTSDLIRSCKYAIEDNERFVKLEARAKKLQEENPEMMILTGVERLWKDISDAEKALGRILETDSHFWVIKHGDPELIEILKRKAKEGKLYE